MPSSAPTDPAVPQRKVFQWTRPRIAKLGTMPDATLAKKFGIHLSTVLKQRQKRGIPASRPAKTIKWTKEFLAMLGKVPDKKLAQLMGCNVLSVFKKREERDIKCYARKSKKWHAWTKKEISLLGKMPDHEVAAKTGIHKSSVQWKRRKMGIPPFGEGYINKKKPRSLEQWTEKQIALIGTMTDAEVAKKLKFAASAVRRKRLSLHIPAYGRRSRTPQQE